eukprot:scaffold145_cov261-Pinguiococcus_pyrenoidosus.AAC.4
MTSSNIRLHRRMRPSTAARHMAIRDPKNTRRKSTLTSATPSCADLTVSGSAFAASSRTSASVPVARGRFRPLRVPPAPPASSGALFRPATPESSELDRDEFGAEGAPESDDKNARASSDESPLVMATPLHPEPGVVSAAEAMACGAQADWADWAVRPPGPHCCAATEKSLPSPFARRPLLLLLLLLLLTTPRDGGRHL